MALQHELIFLVGRQAVRAGHEGSAVDIALDDDLRASDAELDRLAAGQLHDHAFAHHACATTIADLEPRAAAFGPDTNLAGRGGRLDGFRGAALDHLAGDRDRRAGTG